MDSAALMARYGFLLACGLITAPPPAPEPEPTNVFSIEAARTRRAIRELDRRHTDFDDAS